MNIRRSYAPDQYLVTHSVGPNQQGVRLDAFLKSRYRKRSREQLKRAIDSGAITVKRQEQPHLHLGRLKPSFQLIPGDEVLVLSERKPEPEVNFDYKVLYEDDHLFIIDKPANLPVHPAGRFFFNTLLTHLKTQGHATPLRLEREFFLVHRIDRETSGLLVLAKTREVCASLARQFAQRKTKKRYYAVVHGITEEDFTVDLAMKRATGSLIELKMAIMPEEDGGLPAFTRFRRLETAGNFSLLECFPKTGRQHQIRLHLDAVGHPIVGDKLYGMPETEALRFIDRRYLTPEAEAKLLLPRHALHSAGIEFFNPITEQMVEFRSELPGDLRSFLDEEKRKSGSLPRNERDHPIGHLDEPGSALF